MGRAAATKPLLAAAGVPAPAPPPLSPRGERTRAALVAAARVVFERDGFVTARITDIAARARTAVGSFYTYFDSKDAIFRAVLQVVAEEVAAPLPREVSSDPLARIEAGNRAYVHAYKKNARILAVMQHRTFEDPALFELRQKNLRLFVDRAERAIRRLQSDGRVAREVRPRFTAAALSGMVHAFCYETFALGGPTDLDEQEIAAGLTALWRRALGIAPPRATSAPRISRKGTAA